MLKWIKSKIKQRSCIHRTAKVYVTEIVKEVDRDFEVYRVEMNCSKCDKKSVSFGRQVNKYKFDKEELNCQK